jgi:hypothetical protein
MELKQYLTEAEKQYHLRLKTIIPLDDEVMDKIEACVAKYNPLTISSPKKTILQQVPLDFPNVTAAEVYIVDMSFGLPAAPHVLRADIRKVLDAPENYVFVRTQNEPGEIETARLNALADMELEADRRGLKPADVLSDPHYSEADHDAPELYGSNYNAALLDYLGKIETERHEAVTRVEQAPFHWLPLADHVNYNKDIKDAPFVGKPKGSPVITQSILGSQSNHGKIRRPYIDSKGNRVVLTRDLTGGST